MYAIIEISGKQQIVKSDEIIKVDRLSANPGEEVTIKNVLALGEGESLNIGQPFVEGASVVFEVLENRKAKKVMVFKKKRRKGYEVKKGHRQSLSILKVKQINI